MALLKHSLILDKIGDKNWSNEVYNISGKLIELLIEGTIPIHFIEEVRIQNRLYETVILDKEKIKNTNIDLIGMNNITNFTTLEEFINNSNIKLIRI